MSEQEKDRRTLLAYRLWLKGYGLRQLAKMYGIPKSTLSDRFKRLKGNDYSTKRNSRGVVRILQEYRQNPKLSRRNQIEIGRFLATNLEAIAEVEARYPDPLYNDRELQKLTLQECCKGAEDFRVYFDRHWAA